MTEYFKRIDAMLAQHQMPPEYANTQSYLYCNDCEKKSYSKFHFLYHKCGHCQGYNTKVLQTLERPPQLQGAVSASDSATAAAAASVPGGGVTPTETSLANLEPGSPSSDSMTFDLRESTDQLHLN